MQNPDLSKIKNVHFIGIGGIGISAIARMMMAEGKKVSGQDIQDSEVVSELRKIGAEIAIGQSMDAIPAGVELIVYSRAIEVLEPEFLKEIKSLPVLSFVYPEMLGFVSRDKYTIAISGCHGKTTTTGMVAHILMSLGLDPTVVIGSLMQGTKSNFIQGKSEYFVVEADEYYRAFLNLHPDILIITNIDLDHVDYYKDLEDIKSAYRELVAKMSSTGYVVCDTSNADITDVITGCKCKVVDRNQYLYERKLLIPGRHNQIDACLAYTVGILLDLDKEKIDHALTTFTGTSRRFEFKGTIMSQGIAVYDDYAHHPTEIKASLQAFREKYPKSEYKLHVLFQPHLFSRTKALFNEFTKSFDDADEVIILPIFRAREEDDGTVSADLLAKAISENHSNTQSFSDFDSAEKYLRSEILGMTDKDVIVTMGAGIAFKIGNDLLGLS